MGYVPGCVRGRRDEEVCNGAGRSGAADTEMRQYVMPNAIVAE